ncbi:MAG: ATP-binding protein [Anaerolineae bacterium]
MPLQINFLGGLQVTCAAQRTDRFRSNKGRALLAYLVQERRRLHRDRLGALLWPDLPTARARANLSRVLSNLRKLIPDYLLTDRDTVQFDAERSHRIDTEVFRCWAKALLVASEATFDPAAAAQLLDLYRGPFLEDFSLPDCPSFEEWLVIQRERFHQQALEVLERLIQYHIQRGEFEAGRRYVRRALALEPWRETTHRQAMLIAALQGEREQALRHYERCRQILADELDVEPSEETQALRRRILRGDVQPLALKTSAQPALLPLVGRSEPYAWLLARWEAARQGELGLTLVAGEAGIGKTRLVEEVLHHMTGRGATVLRGRCYEFSATVPYQAINTALTEHLASLPAVDAVTIPGAVAAELVGILPAVRRLMPEVEPAPHSQSVQARTHLFDSFAYLLRTLLRPVLFLDDLQWADADTLDLLHYLIRSVHPRALWLVGTYRPEETPVDHPLTRLRRGLRRDGLIHEETLAALTQEDVERLAAGLVRESDRRPLARYLFRQSGGNPFVLEEALKALKAQGGLQQAGTSWRVVGTLKAEGVPERVQDLVLWRVGALSETARWALNYAAVIAQPFAAELLVTVMGEEREVVMEALQAGRARHLVRAREDARYDFVHDRIRETLYQQLHSPVRKLMHERVGQALVHRFGQGDALPDEVAAQIAHHFERSPAPARAIPYLRQAAEAAQRAYAHETAIDYYRRLLPLLEEEARLPIVMELIQLWEHLGQWERARTLIRQTLVRIEPLKKHAEEAYVWLRLSQLQDDQGHYHASLRSAQQAETSARQVESGGEEILALAINRQAWAYYRLADVEAAVEAAQASLVLSERLEHIKGITASLNLLSALHNHRGHYAGGAAALEQALEILRREGDRVGESQILSNLGYTAYQRGDYEGAVTYCREALPIAREVSVRYLEMLCLTNLGGAEAALGRYDQALAHLMQVLDYPESQEWFMLTEVYRYLAEVRLGQGDAEAASVSVQRALALAQEAGVLKYEAMAWRVLAEVAAALPEPPVVGDAVCAPETAFTRALEIFTVLAMEGERMWTLWRWARCLSSQGEQVRSRALFQEAQAMASRLEVSLDPFTPSPPP